MTCLYVLFTGNVNFVCSNLITKNSFCAIHQKHEIYFDHLLKIYCNESYQKVFEQLQSDIFDRCLQSPLITSKHLNNIVDAMMKRSDVREEVMVKLMSHGKFFPDAFDYNIFLQRRINSSASYVQAGLSSYFYKHWLIKLALQSINIELNDCIILITDPYRDKLSTPYYYIKYLLHHVLYPKIEFNNNRVVKIDPNKKEYIDVNETDDLNIFIFDNIYLLDIRDRCFVGKINFGEKYNSILTKQIFDLDDNDLNYLQQNNKSILRIIEDESFGLSEYNRIKIIT